MNRAQDGTQPTTLGDCNARTDCPIVMTEEELIQFLRIPEISRSANHHHVIENLKRHHGLPRIHLCGKTVFLADSVKVWLQRQVIYGQ